MGILKAGPPPTDAEMIAVARSPLIVTLLIVLTPLLNRRTLRDGAVSKRHHVGVKASLVGHLRGQCIQRLLLLLPGRQLDQRVQIG